MRDVPPCAPFADFFPAQVVVEAATTDAPEIALFPEEAATLVGAVPKRRAEFTTVRACARRALAQLGYPPSPILPGPGREPLWPEGIVGSLTHCDGLRSAAVARASAIASIGIDAEVHAPLPGGVAGLITVGQEPATLARLAAAEPTISWDRLLFSTKESVYKAWYPLMHAWLDFTECEMEIREEGTFVARLRVPGPVVSGRAVSEFSGRWAVRGGHVVTGVWLGR